MADFTAEIANSLTRLNAQVRALQTSFDQVQTAAGKAGRTATGGMNSAATAAAKATKEAERLNRETSRRFASAGQAFGKLGGPLGEMGARLFGGGAMQGSLGKVGGLDLTFGRIAAAAAVAGIALKAINAVSEANLDRTRKLIDAEKTLKEARQSANAEMDAQARAGEAQIDPRRRLIAAGGSDAATSAYLLAQSGATTSDQASSATAVIYERLHTDQRRYNAMEGVRALSMLGMPAEQAAAAMADNPAMMDSSAGLEMAMAHTWAGFTGNTTGSPVEAFRAAERRIRQDRASNASEGHIEAGVKIRSTRAEQAEIERRRMVERGEGVARDDIAKAKDPMAAAMLQVAKAQQTQVEELKKLAEGQGVLVGLWKKFTDPQGSFETQMLRLQDAMCRATFGGSR